MLNYNIQIKDLNALILNDHFMDQLRKETLHSRSGMNKEINNLSQKKIANGSIDAKAVIAYSDTTIVGWALLSNEESTCCNSYSFYPVQGTMLQVYVNFQHRRKGIGKALIEQARKVVIDKYLCVIPWDNVSEDFFRANMNFNLKSLVD